MQTQTIPVSNIVLIKRPGSRMPKPTDQDIKGLADSIEQQGVLQDIVVYPTGENGTFGVAAGRRRLVAAKVAGLESLHCKVTTEDKARLIEITENVDREDQSPVCIGQMIKDEMSKGRDVKDIAAMLGKPIRWCNKKLALVVKLHPQIRKAILAEDVYWSTLNESCLKAISRATKEQQDKLYQDNQGAIQKGQLDRLERTVEEIERYLFGNMDERRLGSAPWAMNQTFEGLVPCEDCPARTDRSPDLFLADEAHPDQAVQPQCLNGTCWAKKTDAIRIINLDNQVEKLVEQGFKIVVEGMHRPGISQHINEMDYPSNHRVLTDRCKKADGDTAILSLSRSGLKWNVGYINAKKVVAPSKLAPANQQEEAKQKIEDTIQKVRNKRAALFLDALSTWLAEDQEKAHPLPAASWMALAACIGTSLKKNWSDPDDWKCNPLDMDAAMIIELLGKQVRDVLIDRLKYSTQEQAFGKLAKEAFKIAEVFAFPVEKTEAQIALEHKLPKSLEGRGILTLKKKSKPQLDAELADVKRLASV